MPYGLTYASIDHLAKRTSALLVERGFHVSSDLLKEIFSEITREDVARIAKNEVISLTDRK